MDPLLLEGIPPPSGHRDLRMPLSEDVQLLVYVNNIVYYDAFYPIGLCGNLLTLITVIFMLKEEEYTQSTNWSTGSC